MTMAQALEMLTAAASMMKSSSETQDPMTQWQAWAIGLPDFFGSVNLKFG
jgi:hypothetical protein